MLRRKAQDRIAEDQGYDRLERHSVGVEIAVHTLYGSCPVKSEDVGTSVCSDLMCDL